MFIFCRGLGAFLAGIVLAGGVAQAQWGLDFFERSGRAVISPSCAVGEVDCAAGCVPSRPPVHYEICPPIRPMPCAPVTYHVQGPKLAPSGCANIPCAPPVHYQVICAPAKPAPCVGPIPCLSKLSCTPPGRVNMDCTTTGCAPGGAGCFDRGGLFDGNGFGMREARGNAIVPAAGHAGVKGYQIRWALYPSAGDRRLPRSTAMATPERLPAAGPIRSRTSAAQLYSVPVP